MESLKKRFLKKINKTKTCWLWTAYIDKNGYGRFQTENRSKAAHRVSYEIHFGEIPAGLLVCHSCDVKICVNPTHFFIGTHKDNTQDAVKKKRLWQQKVTHCPKDHPYVLKNTYLRTYKGTKRRICATCSSEKSYAWSKKNPKRVKENYQKFMLTLTPEQIEKRNEYSRKWRKANKDKTQRYDRKRKSKRGKSRNFTVRDQRKKALFRRETD